MKTQVPSCLRVDAFSGLRRENPLGPAVQGRVLACGAGAFVAVDARELTLDASGRVRDQAAAKGTPLFVDCAWCACIRVWVQRDAYSEALYELFANAVQVTRKGYPVIVSAWDTDRGDVLWEIQDGGDEAPERGVGQSAPPAPSWQKCAGLGVAFSAAVIEKHGGSLRFELVPGVGTKATIWLPGRSRS